jgi:hypothetical protein
MDGQTDETKRSAGRRGQGAGAEGFQQQASKIERGSEPNNNSHESSALSTSLLHSRRHAQKEIRRHAVPLTGARSNCHTPPSSQRPASGIDGLPIPSAPLPSALCVRSFSLVCGCCCCCWAIEPVALCCRPAARLLRPAQHSTTAHHKGRQKDTGHKQLKGTGALGLGT